MVIVKYVGRLGNNLFQYSLGRILAEETKQGLQAPTIEGFLGTNDDVNLGSPSLDNYIKFNDHVLRINEEPVSVEQACSMETSFLLDGWFQRYEYYKNHKEKIREWLKIDDIDVGQTTNDAIVHLRLGDCILGSLAEHPYVMPFEYYETALNSTSFDRLYICSDPETLDHPLFDEYMQKFSKYNPTFLGGDTLEDFRAVKSFNKIVMSQSTFSWWAAFLSNASEIFSPVPMPGPHTHEWSLESKNVAIFVDDEDRYKYVKQYEDGWKLVNLQDIPER